MPAVIGAVALGWTLLVFVVDLVRSPAGRDPARLGKLGIAGFSTGACVVLTPGFGYPAVDALLGVERAAGLVGDSFGLAAAGCAQIMVVHWVMAPDRAAHSARLRAAACVACVAVMVAAFICFPANESLPPRSGVASPPYMAIFFAYVCWTGLDVMRYATRYARKIPRRHIRWTLWSFAAAGLGGMAYALTGLIITAADQMGQQQAHDNLVPIYLIGLAIGLTGLCTSLSIPIVGASAHRGYRAYQCLRLHPYWQILTGPYRAVDLGRHISAPEFLACVLARHHQVLARRTLEIRDVYYELRDWMDADVAAKAAEFAEHQHLTGIERDAAIEAAVVAGALMARTRDLPHSGSATLQPGSESMAQEVAWLLRVAAAFDGPVVQRTLLWLEKSTAGPAPR
ncbi:MAB_1171c family putative transporter [Hamadaea tsunoensis]|uniref:MAB_1171c family putative transporter n=1 Tax=Hamadaea tsunoensis TaxID=53368 RepID=UPI0004801EFF|nr:MAB_1171c family putative transporter [Hamadaea tsunoensis]